MCSQPGCSRVLQQLERGHPHVLCCCQPAVLASCSIVCESVVLLPVPQLTASQPARLLTCSALAMSPGQRAGCSVDAPETQWWLGCWSVCGTCISLPHVHLPMGVVAGRSCLAQGSLCSHAAAATAMAACAHAKPSIYMHGTLYWLGHSFETCWGSQQPYARRCCCSSVCRCRHRECGWLVGPPRGC